MLLNLYRLSSRPGFCPPKHFLRHFLVDTAKFCAASPQLAAERHELRHALGPRLARMVESADAGDMANLLPVETDYVAHVYQARLSQTRRALRVSMEWSTLGWAILG